MVSFFKMRKPRSFEHKPIYWDPKREKAEERERRIKRELGMEEDLNEYKPSIKGSFVEGTSHLKKSIDRGNTAESRKYKSMRLLIILAAMLVIGWILFWR